ncbi:right-handed parallel beta-helix repeat-containing protein [Mongoliitalea lutea]|uniref:Right handed beta helix domain-containing protein n=1 Tax=Mongoliitalea lutea TaxID=849756 RepID=A0A8J3G4S9_9BACT|nr:right-handed parallel beta-helix repeat-containing protein [Mongoliitalea lutea]GHB31491.1 hypothetical protein GCM10008106_10360 [Mongoliitalea lutea]
MDRRKFLKVATIAGVSSFFDFSPVLADSSFDYPRPELILEKVKQVPNFAELKKVAEDHYAVVFEKSATDGLYKIQNGLPIRIINTSINLDWIDEHAKTETIQRIIELNRQEKLQYAIYLGNGTISLSETLYCDNQIFWGDCKVIPDVNNQNFVLKIIGNHNVLMDLEFFEETYTRTLLEVKGSDNLVENCHFRKERKSTANRVIYSDRFLWLSDPKGRRNKITSCTFNNGRIGTYLEGNYTVTNCEVSNCITGLLLRPSSNGSEISYNRIFDNNVNNHSGADGILAQRNVTNLHIHHNSIFNSGEHGIYFQGDNSLIEKNTVNFNHKSGIKLASYSNNLFLHSSKAIENYLGNNIIVKDNNCDNNCKHTKDQTNAGIYLQAPLINIHVINNSCSFNTYGIRSTSLGRLKTEEFSTKAILKDLIIEKNEAFNTSKASLYIEGETGVKIISNRVASLLTNAKSSSHRIQGVVIRDNFIQDRLTLNRANEAKIKNNQMGNLVIISNSRGGNHTIRNNNQK